MLKLISSSRLRLTTTVSSTTRCLNTPSSINCSGALKSANPGMNLRASFSSFSSTNGEEKEVKSAADSLDATPLTVLAFPFAFRPLFPGFRVQLLLEDAFVLAALQKIKSEGREDEYCGIFMIKDDQVNDPNVLISIKSGEFYTREGKHAFPHLHKVGTLAQIIEISDVHMPIIIGLQRVRIMEMVCGDPLTVKVDLLEDKPYKDSNALKATASEVMSTLRDVLKITDLREHHLNIMSKHCCGEFDYSLLADYGAAMSADASRLKCQEVLEELDVHKRLKLALELLKKDVELSKLQVLFALGLALVMSIEVFWAKHYPNES